jgi:alpha-glucosidase
VRRHRWAGDRWLLDCEGAAVRISPLEGGAVRVELGPGGVFGRDHSWSVQDWRPARGGSVRERRGVLELSAGAVGVRIRRGRLQVGFVDGPGPPVAVDAPGIGMGWRGGAVRCWKRLRRGDRFYGLGEKAGPLDLRGREWQNWNTDAAEHEPGSDPLYQAHPFVMCVNRGRAYGLFFDNAHRSTFDLGATSGDWFSFGADGGRMDYTFLPGPRPADVVRRYTALVGRPALPPLWALGYQQSRYSYESAARLQRVAAEFRRRRIPCDTLYLDIDYMSRFRVFTWSRRKFPRPRALCASLAAKGFRLVATINPGVRVEPRGAVYVKGLAGGHFCKGTDGRTHVGTLWPGPCAYPDFTRKATRRWWAGLCRRLAGVGLSGLWTDMNEPADLKRADKTLPPDVRFHNEGRPADHRACHNVYGLLMARATHEGLAAADAARPFVLTRAGYSGVQRYAAVWTGDNKSDWAHLRMSVPMLLNMGLSGLAFCGADIGGFRGEATAELFTRWLQLGIFYPLCRAHTCRGPEQDPWSYGRRHERINRAAIELRYALLPYLYTEMRHAATTGEPVMRPLVLDFPDWAPATSAAGRWAAESQFMFGRQVLVAPVLEEGARRRPVWLPPGEWRDFHTGRRVHGGRVVTVRAGLETIPMFARAGAVIPTRRVLPHTQPGPVDELVLRVYRGEGGGEAYLDDGWSGRHLHGDYRLERYTVQWERGRALVRLAKCEGVDRYAPVRYVLRLVGSARPPREVRLAGERVTEVSSRREAKPGSSRQQPYWRYDRPAREIAVWLGAWPVGAAVEVR